jgi:hypothetical protein
LAVSAVSCFVPVLGLPSLTWSYHLRASHERLRQDLELLRRRIFVAKAERVDSTLFAALGHDVGSGTKNGEVGMAGGQSMGQLLSKDSGAREWKHASRPQQPQGSGAATP